MFLDNRRLDNNEAYCPLDHVLPAESVAALARNLVPHIRD